MRVFKFGGASVKDADGVKNLTSIVGRFEEDLVIVVSAMGKTTNLLEKLCMAYFHGEPTSSYMFELCSYHLNVAKELFHEDNIVFSHLADIFTNMEDIMMSEPSLCYDYEYDRIICFGEILSTTIVSCYLNYRDIKNKFTDIRKYLKSDNNYRNANIDLELSTKLCREYFTFTEYKKYVTQGFIAGNRINQTTTLGREGSDYTAALLANILDAQDVTIWKDVPGVMNADPKEYDKAIIIDNMSYREAIELSHFGAKVIHPKTIKPLQNKQIPLYVRSFLYPECEGTVIKEFDEKLILPPILIHKGNQCLLTITPQDFSFIAEEKLSYIFSILAKYKIKLNLMQNSAISFTLLIDYNPAIFKDFIAELQNNYEVLYNKDVCLITIRHYNNEVIRDIIGDQEVLVEQRNRNTARFVIPSI